MEPLKLLETTPGKFSLILSENDVDAVVEVVEELGRIPNGYFWEGVAKTLLREEAADIEDRLDFDSEAGMFCAYGSDRAALEQLGALMAPLVTEPKRLRVLMKRANPMDFDD